MSLTQILFILSFLSLTVTTVAFPIVLRYALRHQIVDNPNARKLHRKPIPIMGGVAVYAGILVGCLAMSLLVSGASIRWSIMAITVMLGLGIWDDIKDLSAILRLFVQFGIVGFYIGFTGHYIGNFYGFLGIHEISMWIGIPLSLVVGVGTINAINMIDGVDGYSSGYGMMACASFAAVFIAVNISVWSCLAVIVASALLPFFMHNVFGIKSKMFIGDGGTMMLGFMMTIFELGVLSLRGKGSHLESQGIGLIAMTMAILCIPIFDTLRVMTARIVRGCSPFKADKTHLHHLFIDMGFSHIGAAISILSLNFIVMVMWLISWQCGLSITMQTWIVVMMGLAVTFGFYKLMRWHQNHGPLGEDGEPQGTPFWHAACRLGRWSHKETGAVWRMVQALVDGTSALKTSAIRDVLDVLRVALIGGELSKEYSVEKYKKILWQARKQTVFAIVLDELGKKPLGMEKADLQSLIKTSLKIRKQYTRRILVLKELAMLLNSHGVNYVVVKGLIVGQNYPDPALRQEGDIDFYCEGKDFSIAQNVIEKEWDIKYEQNTIEHHHVEFVYKKVPVEQHHKLIKLYDKRKNQYWSDLCRKYSMKADFDGVPVYTLAPTLHVIYIFLHLYHHLLELGVGLRQFCDWAVMLHAHSNDIDYEAMRTYLSDLGMERPYRACGTILVDWLGITERELGYNLTKSDRRYTNRILDIVAYRGNMGLYEGRYVRNDGKKLHRMKAVVIKFTHFMKFVWLAPGFTTRWLMSELWRKM